MAGLLDFAQAASNSAAGNVAGPIDMLAWGLRKMGLPIPNDPVLGTEWMKQKGLIKEVPQSPASLAGETLGLLSPIVAAAKAPQIAGGLLQMGDNLTTTKTLGSGPGGGQKGAIVYHGSPHKFDKFDSSKIGTGEGAQAYGHGIYTAEAPDVARSYMALGHMQGNVSKVGRKPINDVYSQLETAEQQLFGNRYIDQATKNARGRVISDQKAMLEDLMNNGLVPDVLKSAKDSGYSPEAVKWFEKQVAPRYQPSGNLYKVDLPDEHIARMLDWDKPLSQQAPEVRSAVEKLAPKNRSGQPMTDLDASGAEILRALGIGDGSSSLLRQQGIPGIRYLDGGSRGAGQGTSNFVVFPGNEGLLTILERNGVPLR